MRLAHAGGRSVSSLGRVPRLVRGPESGWRWVYGGAGRGLMDGVGSVFARVGSGEVALQAALARVRMWDGR